MYVDLIVETISDKVCVRVVHAPNFGYVLGFRQVVRQKIAFSLKFISPFLNVCKYIKKTNLAHVHWNIKTLTMQT